MNWFKREKVYCINCRYLTVTKDDYICTHPENSLLRIIPESAIYPERSITTETSENPEAINANNDCKWYKDQRNNYPGR